MNETLVYTKESEEESLAKSQAVGKYVLAKGLSHLPE